MHTVKPDPHNLESLSEDTHPVSAALSAHRCLSSIPPLCSKLGASAEERYGSVIGLLCSVGLMVAVGVFCVVVYSDFVNER